MKSNKLYNGLIVTIGVILSPLSRRNDVLINFPISYIIALPFGKISQDLFIPVFILAYWLTNILGFVMIHHGSKGLLHKDKKTQNSKEIHKIILITTIYTLLIFALVYFEILSFPEELMNKVSGY